MDQTTPDQPIVPVPPPWKLKGTIYVLSFWTKEEMPVIAYSPLEAKSPFADPAASGEHLGGLSQIQIIRYTDSPVGPYDELIVCPGFFAYTKDDDKGESKRMKNARVTRVYVSQKSTCWNGRINWNIPKHLARFEWEGLPGGKTRVRVYPYDTAAPSDGNDSAASESGPSEKVLLQATFQPMRWAPSFPLSFSWLKYVGIDATLVQPPLPDGRQDNPQAGEELIGTDRWCKILPVLSTRKATLGWIDMSQHNSTTGDNKDVNSSNGSSVTDAKYENFWPGLRRWNLAIKMENADINFGEGVYWGSP